MGGGVERQFSWQIYNIAYIFDMVTSHLTAEQYKERQIHLDTHYIHRVIPWLVYFKITYAWKVIHIIEWPKESKFPKRRNDWKVSILARFLWVWAKIRFSVGGIVWECPSFKPASMKATNRRVEMIKKKWLKALLIKEVLSEWVLQDQTITEEWIKD